MRTDRPAACAGNPKNNRRAGRFGSGIAALAAATGLLLFAACGNSDEDRLTAGTPEEAASGLDSAFATASDTVKHNVSAATEALRKGQYEKAVVSLQTVQQAPGITLEQGMAIRSSAIVLEHQLINAIENGDPRARQAYELLKQLNRN